MSIQEKKVLGYLNMLGKSQIWVETEPSEPSLPSRDKSFVKAAKSYARAGVKVFDPVQFYLTSLPCPVCFFPKLYFRKIATP